MTLADLRRNYHAKLCTDIICVRTGKRGPYHNFADADNAASIAIARGIVSRISAKVGVTELPGQTAGGLFERYTREFIQESFELLQHIRPGAWRYSTRQPISDFSQYTHLADLEAAILANQELSASLGADYIVKPDITVSRLPVNDAEVNLRGAVVDEHDGVARLTPLREAATEASVPILHASISCKWTIRSDRSQNSRTEALNLIRNRKGHVPHIAVVTAEPLPTRLASLALGTGDLDCVYHFALNELQEAIREIENDDQMDMLTTLVGGKRLRDISDLPFDLAI